MHDIPPGALTPFVFSDPAGKRWPRLRLALLILGVLAFLGTVLFVQTLFVAPQMRVPFSLRQLKGQLKALQKANPASQIPPSSLLWQKFAAAKQAAKKLAGATATPAPLAKPRKKAPPDEVRLAFYTNGAPHSYASLEEHASLITHLCPQWVGVDRAHSEPGDKKARTEFLHKFCDPLHDDEKELWLTVQPGQQLDYIDFDQASHNVDRFVASHFDETSELDPPGPLGSRPWFE